MKAIGEFRGVYHVTIHIPDEDGGPLCDGRREPGNELYGPHEMAVTPCHPDVCPNCREYVPESEMENGRYTHERDQEVVA